MTRHLKKGGSNKDVARILKLLSVLPRLPANEIKKGFKVIKQEAEKTLDSRLKKKMDKLFQYFNNQWLIKTSAEELSVHGKNVRVTSGLESINARINDLMPMKHPHFWIWLGKVHHLVFIESHPLHIALIFFMFYRLAQGL